MASPLPPQLRDDFVVRREGASTAVIHRDFEPGFRALGLLGNADPPEGAPRPPGGRGDAWIGHPPGHDAVLVRPGRRGGLVGRFVRARYFLGNRFVDELVVTERLRRLGAPVPCALAAVRRDVWPGYETWLATALIPDASSAAKTLAVVPPEAVSGVLGTLGRTVRALHDVGGDHADLNAWNVLLDTTEAPPGRGWIVDLDRARVREAPLRASRARANLDRLRRSLDRLGLQHALDAWPAFEAGYTSSTSSDGSAS